MRTITGEDLGAGSLARVIDDAILAGVPEWLAEDAARITARRLGGAIASPATERDQDRLRAYYWGVVRRMCFESSDGSLRALQQRYIRASIESDLRRSRPNPPERYRSAQVGPVQLELAIA